MNSEKRVSSKKNNFLKLNSEKDKINQYWFSESTIEFIVRQIETIVSEFSNNCIKIAFVSTPSIFFSIRPELQDNSILFEYDDKLIKKHKNGVKFDYNDYISVSQQYYNYFDLIIVDPPYINEVSWTKYAEFINLISKNDKEKIICKILTCSIAENSDLLKKLLNLDIKKYQPSIPHLVYQYNFFANYDDEEFEKMNDEIII